MGTIDKQVGGQHYQLPYQPVKFSVDLCLNFIQGNIVKYVTRYKQKDGEQDLQKVLHYAHIGRKLKPMNLAHTGFIAENSILAYQVLNNLDPIVSNIVKGAVYQDWDSIEECTKIVIQTEYGKVY